VTDDNTAAYADAENYDVLENDDGIAFYTALAQETGGPVLEIACGTGRVTIPIARLGLAVTGLDVVPEMLDQARPKSADLPIRWVEADGRDFDLGQRFRLIFLTGNAFQQFLTNADQDGLLRCAHAHLHPDGLFAFETRNPVWSTPSTRDDLDARIEQSRQNGGFFALLETRDEEFPWQTYTATDGREIRESLTQTYDPLTQILRLTFYERWTEGNEERTKIGYESLRFNFPQELDALLTHHGFTIIRQYGDWTLEPLTPTSRSIIVVCRKSP
jgi:SAM-dependent methyltransferase